MKPFASGFQLSGKFSIRGSQFLVRNRFLGALLLGTVLFVAGGADAQDKPIALKGGKVLTVSHGTIDNGVLVMQSGKIIAVGAAGSVNIPSNAQVIDSTGM